MLGVTALVLVTGVHLDYQRDDTAALCPSAEALAARVAARLGYAPWDARATVVIRVIVERRRDGWHAQLARINDGSVEGERQLDSRADDCHPLAEAIELAVAITIDPLSLGRPAQEDPPKPPPPPAMVEASPAPPPPAASGSEHIEHAAESEPWQLHVGTAVYPAFGLLPGPSLGLGVFAELQGELWSARLQGQLDILGSKAVEDGEVGASLIRAAFVPCARWRWLAVCAPVTLGEFRAATKGLADAQTPSALWVAVGGRLEAELRLFDWVLQRFFVTVMAPITQMRFTDTRTAAEFWRADAVFVTMGLDLGWRMIRDTP